MFKNYKRWTDIWTRCKCK